MTEESADIGRMFGATQAVETFLGFPACSDLGALEAEIAILGAPCATAYASVGPYCAGGPAAIRAGIAGAVRPSSPWPTSSCFPWFSANGHFSGPCDSFRPPSRRSGPWPSRWSAFIRAQ